MQARALKSWKIRSPDHFYPISIKSIGFDTEYAITVYAMHRINTFIFRNFGDAIANDKCANKCCLHRSLQPESIIDVAVGGQESVVLTESGNLKFFKSPKKLVNVDYLTNVKAVCSSQEGFALLRMGENGRELSIEMHPDSFRDEAPENNRRIFGMDFDASYSHWKQSAFKIKELNFPKIGENKFAAALLKIETEHLRNQSEHVIFFSMDRDLFALCSSGPSAGESFTASIAVCSSEIESFWSINGGNMIAILLKSGVMQILSLNSQENGVTSENIYLGDQVLAYAFPGDFFAYSTGFEVERIKFSFETPSKLSTKSDRISLPGIVALTFIKEFSAILAINENCQSYVISMEKTAETEKKYTAIHESAKFEIRKLRHEFLRLTEAYNTTIAKRTLREQCFEAVQLKQRAVLDESDGRKIYYFVAKCVTMKSPVSASDSFTVIYVKNSLIYDRSKSLFAHIILTAAVYANQFDSNLWNLRLRWTNDKSEMEYANVKLPERALAKPVAVLVHFYRGSMDALAMEVNAGVGTGDAIVYISFPVHITHEHQQLFVARPIEPSPAIESEFQFHAVVSVPKSFTAQNVVRAERTERAVHHFEINFFGQRLLLSQCEQIIELRTNDLDAMRCTKAFIYDAIRRSAESSPNKLAFRVPAIALKEYNNARDYLDRLSKTERDADDVQSDLLKCIDKLRRIKVLAFDSSA